LHTQRALIIGSKSKFEASLVIDSRVSFFTVFAHLCLLAAIDHMSIAISEVTFLVYGGISVIANTLHFH